MDLSKSWKDVILLFVLSCSYFVNVFAAKHTLNKIYENLQGNYTCYRMHNGTHQFGCASERSGNVGIVHMIYSQADLDWLLNKGQHEPYMFVTIPEMFNRENLLALKTSGKVSGGVLLKSSTTATPSGFSPDQKCPNHYSGLYKNTSYFGYCEATPWNKAGEELITVDWGFPIFLITDEESINKTVDCYNQFNNVTSGVPDWPLCAMELKADMYAAVDAETCIRRTNLITSLTPIRMCDPLGDKNVHAVLFPRNKTDNTIPVNNRSVVMVAARMDSFSLFEGVSPGGDSSLTGLVTLLATSDLLRKMRPEIESKAPAGSNIFFVLFHGESFDYIGSSRMVYDMGRGNFPQSLSEGNPHQEPLLNVSQLKSVVELNQLATHGGSNTLFLHTDPISNQDSDIKNSTQNLVGYLMSAALHTEVDLSEVGSEAPLPPSSFQTFLKEAAIPGVVITNHQQEYRNTFYNSLYDESSNVGYFSEKKTLSRFLSDVSLIVAKGVYQELTGDKYSGSVESNVTLVDELLKCYLQTASCTLFKSVFDSDFTKHLKNEPFPTYVSVVSKPEQPSVRIATHLLLAYLTGDFLDVNKSDCHSSFSGDQIYGYYWMPGEVNSTGMCYRSTVKTSQALSPAFSISDYDWKSGQYSTWTESVWQPTTARIFLKPSRSQEIVTLCTGIVILLVSFIVVYFVNRQSSVVFIQRGMPDC